MKTKNKGFYNEAVKNQFLAYYVNDGIENPDSSESARTVDGRTRKAASLFNTLSPYEKAANKDVLFFNPVECLELIKDRFAHLSYNSNKQHLHILRIYYEWGAGVGLISVNDLLTNPFMMNRGRGTGTRNNMIDSVAESIDSRKVTDSVNFIFKTPDDFFEWIELFFGDSERWVMTGAICVLTYYGFNREQTRSILRSDVDTANKIVCGVKIENEIAFRMIQSAMNADSILVECSDGKNKRYYYNESKYLIRRTGLGNKPSEQDGRVPLSKFAQLVSEEQKASERLTAEYSKYKQIRISEKTIFLLQCFHKALVDESEFGYEYVKEKIGAGAYNRNDLARLNLKLYEQWKRQARSLSDL